MKKQIITLVSLVLFSSIAFAGLIKSDAMSAKPTLTNSSPAVGAGPRSVVAQPKPGIKIGVVNVQEIFNHSSAVQSTKAKLKKQFAVKKKQVQASAMALKAMIADYKKNASVMQASARLALQKKITAKQSSIMGMESAFQQQAGQSEQAAMAKFVKQIQSVAASIAKQKHLDLVLPEHSLLYSSDKLDITKQVAAQFNK